MYFKIEAINPKDNIQAKIFEELVNFLYEREMHNSEETDLYDRPIHNSKKTLDNIVKERIKDFELKPKREITVCTPYGHDIFYDEFEFIRKINNDPILSSNVVYYSDSDSINKKEEDIWNMKELIKENLSEANFKKQCLLEPECGKPKKKDQFGYIKRKQR